MVENVNSNGTVWAPRDQVLPFRLGPLHLARVHFRALSLEAPFIELPNDIDATRVELNDFRGYEAAIILGHPVQKEPRWFRFSDGLLRYCSFSETRFLVELRGTFADYMKKFSAKRRHNFVRTVKKFSEFAEGDLGFKTFSSAEEIVEFHELAIAISRKTYQSEMGFGFQESEKFRAHLISEAEQGRVRGYVLYCKGVPVSYIFCRLRNTTIFYTHIGYDPDFGKFSPGMVALYMLLEDLFQEGRFAYLDFFGGQYWQYKQVYSTLSIRSVTVYYLPASPKNFVIVFSHAAVRCLEKAGVNILRLFRRPEAEKA